MLSTVELKLVEIKTKNTHYTTYQTSIFIQKKQIELLVKVKNVVDRIQIQISENPASFLDVERHQTLNGIECNLSMQTDGAHFVSINLLKGCCYRSDLDPFTDKKITFFMSQT